MGGLTVSGKKAKWAKKAGVAINVMMEKAGFNVGARRQKLFNVVLGVKLRRMNWKTQSETAVASELHKEAFKIEA